MVEEAFLVAMTMMSRTVRGAAAVVFAAAAAISAGAAEIVVVAHETGYTTSLAKHIHRWLGDQGVKSELTTPAGMEEAMKDSKLVFLLGFADPTGDELSKIMSAREKGTRFVVFHSASPQLAKMMGVKPLGYTEAAYPGRWSRMNFTGEFLEGCPKSVLQTSTVLQRAEPIPGKSRVLATWSDRTGRSTGDAAWIASAAGYWMTHVLLADGDEELKAQFLGAIVGSVAPRLWNAKAFRAKRVAEERALREYASRQKRRPGEIRAVWDHSGCGLHPGDWKKTICVLRDYGITDVFVNVAGAGFAHYQSDVLPRSKTFRDEGDQLKACIEAANGTGIRVHAWVICFNATRATESRLEAFEKRGWRLRTKDGKLSEYLDPSNADVRKYLLDAIDEIQEKYAVDGIHLDFVRWYERSVKPADAADTISRFVATARLHVRRPTWFTVAVLGKYPACVASVGQDWDGWVDSKIVDYVVPMDYTEDMEKYESFLAQHARRKGNAQRTIVGIGVTANESRLSPREVIDQIVLSRRYGMAGVALFDLDTSLEKRFLPILALGLFK